MHGQGGPTAGGPHRQRPRRQHHHRRAQRGGAGGGAARYPPPVESRMGVDEQVDLGQVPEDLWGEFLRLLRQEVRALVRRKLADRASQNKTLGASCPGF